MNNEYSSFMDLAKSAELSPELQKLCAELAKAEVEFWLSLAPVSEGGAA